MNNNFILQPILAFTIISMVLVSIDYSNPQQVSHTIPFDLGSAIFGGLVTFFILAYFEYKSKIPFRHGVEHE